ncbi:hypothetical protein ACFSQ7_00290 [Paenibacillus rhizoplanae]
MMLNLTLNLYAARNNLRNESVSNMKITAKQVAVSVEQSGYSSNYVQDKNCPEPAVDRHSGVL